MESQLEGHAEEEVVVASQWQLIRWRFVRHKLAVVAGVVILGLYVLAIFPQFFAPYAAEDRDFRNAFMPPQRIHFFSEEGFSLQPFVYGINKDVDFVTTRTIYTEDTSQRFPVDFFVRGGEPYQLLGFIETDIRLFGVDPEATVYLMGTDSVGRDVFSQIIHGARISLFLGLMAVLLSLTLGVVIGGISGYFGGKVDNVIQRLIEIIWAFPSLALWMALTAALPRTWSQTQVYFALVVILSLISWTTLAREVRGKMLSLREEDFIMTARLNGNSTPRLLRVHMVSSFTSHIIASLTLAIPGIILAETALSFLGIGLARPTVSWGVLLQQAQKVEALTVAWWLFLPGAVLVITVLAFNFLGDGLRDAADPYSALD
ncbi:MAG TPA: ABC transporter permease [Actinobacteria bacterium]|nr:ABC transporter permease [Actinomycetota bacterium]